VGVAREIAQHFLGATERPFAVDDPFAVAQRSQIGGKVAGQARRYSPTRCASN
jgi:hypothetical protein